MCSYIVEKARLAGSAKGASGWMRIDTANVYFDHPYHAPLDHALGIDFVCEADGARERVAVELSAQSARDLVKSADLILTMSAQHRARVAELGGEDKVRVLGEYVGRDESKAEVSDPFGSDLASYRETYDELQELIGLVVSRVAGTVR